MHKILFIYFLTFSLVIHLSAQNTSIGAEKISPTLTAQVAAGTTNLDFIIILNNQTDLSAAAEKTNKVSKGTYVLSKLQATALQTQEGLVNYLNQQSMPYRSFYVVNAIKAIGNADQLMTIAQFPTVKKIIANSPYRIDVPTEVAASQLTPTEIEWGIQMIGADQVWEMGYTGQGAVIGGQDTGYDWTHPALQTKYRGYVSAADTVDHNYNWHDAIHSINPLNGDTTSSATNNPCGLDVNAPCDDNRHGTHTMGTMVGSDGENQVGVAPDAKWVGCRNMERGWGSPASYIECFEWLMAPTDLNNENPNPALAPHAFANSWGCPPIEGCDTSNFSVMETVVNNVKASGVVVVVSAGNSGSECSTVTNPAAIFENSFTVGSTRSNDTISGFSSRGPVLVDGSMRMKPDISAPGSQVRSTVLDNQYAVFSGTSMAGPHVVGVVALIISANPSLAGQVDQIEEIIKQSAVAKMTDQDCGNTPGTNAPNNTYGHGRIDALAAVQLALMTTPTEDLFTLPINVYPNPFTNELHFDLGEITGHTSVELFNATGQLMIKSVFEGTGAHQLNLSEVSNGIYFYHLKNGNRVMRGKVVKE